MRTTLKKYLDSIIVKVERAHAGVTLTSTPNNLQELINPSGYCQSSWDWRGQTHATPAPPGLRKETSADRCGYLTIIQAVIASLPNLQPPPYYYGGMLSDFRPCIYSWTENHLWTFPEVSASSIAYSFRPVILFSKGLCPDELPKSIYTFWPPVLTHIYTQRKWGNP